MVSATGCLTSHGLLQTAHTQPPGSVRAKIGAARLQNEIDDQGGRGPQTNTTAEAGVRLGVTDFLDLGLAPLLGAGAALDAKADLLDNTLPGALAPRLSVGHARESERSAWAAEAGLIGSYRCLGRVEPYAALNFANYWISRDQSLTERWLEDNQTLAERRGYGDGLVNASLGADLRVTGWLSAVAEYSHWFTAQNDPGDGYAFLPSDIFALALSFGSPEASQASDRHAPSPRTP